MLQKVGLCGCDGEQTDDDRLSKVVWQRGQKVGKKHVDC